MKSIYWRIPISAALYASAIGMLVLADSYPGQYACCRGFQPDRPSFNSYLLSWSGPICHDPPLVDVRVIGSSGRNGRLAQNAEEHHEGIGAAAGETVRVVVWFHNSGSEENRAETTAKGVRIGARFDREPSQQHRVFVMITAENAEAIRSTDDGGDVIVSTATPTILEYVPGSTGLCLQTGAAFEKGASTSETCSDYADKKCRYFQPLGDGVANGAVKIGDIKAGDGYTGYVVFDAKVVQPNGAGK